MINNLDITDFEKDKIWYGLIDLLFSEEIEEYGENIVDIEEIASAGSWLSMNFSALDEKIRTNLMGRLDQINEAQLMRFFEAINYLFEDEDDRETEVMLLLQLLQLAPSVRTQAAHILDVGNVAQSWKDIAALVAGLMYEEDISDMVSVEGNIHDLQQEEAKWDESQRSEDTDCPF